MKRLLVGSFLCAIAFAQSTGGFSVKARPETMGMDRGVWVDFQSDASPQPQAFIVEIHCMVNGQFSETKTFAMARFGGSGATFVPLGNLDAKTDSITAQSWEVTGIGRSSWATH